MAEDPEPYIPAIVREIMQNPAVSDVWTEIENDHRIWLARGANGHPWLLASDNLARFRQMITENP